MELMMSYKSSSPCPGCEIAPLYFILFTLSTVDTFWGTVPRVKCFLVYSPWGNVDFVCMFLDGISRRRSRYFCPVSTYYACFTTVKSLFFSEILFCVFVIIVSWQQFEIRIDGRVLIENP
jgi:hypothetical protein